VHDLHPSQYAVAVYGGEWDIANVVELEVSIEHGDVYRDLMKPKGPARSFSWPSRKHQSVLGSTGTHSC